MNKNSSSKVLKGHTSVLGTVLNKNNINNKKEFLIMAKTQFVGSVQSLKRFEAKEEGKFPNFAITIRERRNYKETEGKFKGKHASDFFDILFFAKTEKQVALIENYVKTREGDSSKIMTIDADIKPSAYEKNGKMVYGVDFIATNLRFDN